jgi:hypothetical protein
MRYLKLVQPNLPVIQFAVVFHGDISPVSWPAPAW